MQCLLMACHRPKVVTVRQRGGCQHCSVRAVTEEATLYPRLGKWPFGLAFALGIALLLYDVVTQYFTQAMLPEHVPVALLLRPVD